MEQHMFRNVFITRAQKECASAQPLVRNDNHTSSLFWASTSFLRSAIFFCSSLYDCVYCFQLRMLAHLPLNCSFLFSISRRRILFMALHHLPRPMFGALCRNRSFSWALAAISLLNRSTLSSSDWLDGSSAALVAAAPHFQMLPCTMWYAQYGIHNV